MQSLKILIVEDSETTSEKYCDWLSHMSYEEIQLEPEVVVIPNGYEGVEVYQKALDAGEPFQIVVLDHQLPALNGSEVYTRIREVEGESKYEHRAYVIFSTTNTNQHLIVRLLKSGADHYLIKPVEENIFLNAVNRYFESE